MRIFGLGLLEEFFGQLVSKRSAAGTVRIAGSLAYCASAAKRHVDILQIRPLLLQLLHEVQPVFVELDAVFKQRILHLLCPLVAAISVAAQLLD